MTGSHIHTITSQESLRQLHEQEHYEIRRKRQKWFEDYVITRFEKVNYNEVL